MVDRAKINMSLESWRISASSAHIITTHRPGMTDAQERMLAELEGKRETEKGLTAVQSRKLLELRAKREAKDELPDGAITFLKSEYNRIKYGIFKEVGGKALEKGRIAEGDSLDLVSEIISDVYGVPVFLPKNKLRRENDFAMGEIDSKYRGVVIDVKSSWDKDSFDAVKDVSYEYFCQMQTYISLENVERGILAHCLVDTPEQLVYDEYRRALWSKGIIDEDSDEAREVEEQVRRNHEYKRISTYKKVKFFLVERDDDYIKFLRSRVLLCREWLLEWDAKNNENEVKGFIRGIFG